METVRKLRGPKGTKVTVTIMREKFDRPKDFTITRGVIPIMSVRSEIPEDGYGYIRIRQFSERTDREFREALDKWQKSTEGLIRGLVLDLRDNPGGLLDQAVKVADRFIDSGVIVSIRGRLPEGLSPDDDRSLIILQGTSHDFGTTGASIADEDHHGIILLSLL